MIIPSNDTWRYKFLNVDNWQMESAYSYWNRINIRDNELVKVAEFQGEKRWKACNVSILDDWIILNSDYNNETKYWQILFFLLAEFNFN